MGRVRVRIRVRARVRVGVRVRVKVGVRVGVGVRVRVWPRSGEALGASSRSAAARRTASISLRLVIGRPCASRIGAPGCTGDIRKIWGRCAGDIREISRRYSVAHRRACAASAASKPLAEKALG